MQVVHAAILLVLILSADFFVLYKNAQYTSMSQNEGAHSQYKGWCFKYSAEFYTVMLTLSSVFIKVCLSVFLLLLKNTMSWRAATRVGLSWLKSSATRKVLTQIDSDFLTQSTPSWCIVKHLLSIQCVCLLNAAAFYKCFSW